MYEEKTDTMVFQYFKNIDCNELGCGKDVNKNENRYEIHY